MPSSGPVAVASVLELEFTVQKKLLFNGVLQGQGRILIR